MRRCLTRGAGKGESFLRFRGCAEERRRDPVALLPVRQEGRGIAETPQFERGITVAEFVFLPQKGDSIVEVP